MGTEFGTVERGPFYVMCFDDGGGDGDRRVQDSAA